MSRNRTDPRAGFADRAKMPKGPNGRNLCRECGEECPGKRADRTFCGPACVDAWKVRTSPAHVRHLLKKRDDGVCALCGLDTEELRGAFLRAQRWPGANELVANVEMLRPDELEATRTRRFNGWWRDQAENNRMRAPACRAKLLGFDPYRSTWWDADHITPVVEGGGECGIDGFRTLCQPCHKRATAELARRRADARRSAERAA